MPRHTLLTVLACATLLTACASNRQLDEDFPAPAHADTRVNVDNRGFLDMTIYVVNGSQRVRLGIARGHAEAELVIPPHLVQGVTPLRFLCDPIGGNRVPVSDEIAVEPGDRVTLVIPAS